MLLVENPEKLLEQFIKTNYMYQSVQTIDGVMLASEYFKNYFNERDNLQNLNISELNSLYIDTDYGNLCRNYYNFFDTYTDENFKFYYNLFLKVLIQVESRDLNKQIFTKNRKKYRKNRNRMRKRRLREQNRDNEEEFSEVE